MKRGGLATARECTFKADFLCTTEAWLHRMDENHLPAFPTSPWLKDTSLRITTYPQ